VERSTPEIFTKGNRLLRMDGEKTPKRNEIVEGIYRENSEKEM